MSLDDGLHGVLVTPFDAAERVDLESLDTLVDFYCDAGATGLLVLGVLGESALLSDDERETVALRVFARARHTQVTVGVAHVSTVVTAERAKWAQANGAAAVLVSPPHGTMADAALLSHFRRVSAAIEIPLVIQDLPSVSGVDLPVEFLVKLSNVVREGSAVKLEAPPTAPKIAELAAAAPHLKLFGGLGGVSLLEELRSGTRGTITGFAFPEVLVTIISRFLAGDHEAATFAFARALPALTFEAQFAGPALRKRILTHRGVIDSPTVREPSRPVPTALLGAIEEIAQAMREPEFDV